MTDPGFTMLNPAAGAVIARVLDALEVDVNGAVDSVERGFVDSVRRRRAGCNLNAPAIMLAKKLADAIRGKTPLPRSGAYFFAHPHHQSA